MNMAADAMPSFFRPQVVEIIVKKDAPSLLVLALRGGDLALIEHIVNIIGDEVRIAGTEWSII